MSKSNGHDKNGDDKIVHFPSNKEREAQYRAEYKARKRAEKAANHQPFFNSANIPPFAKFFTLSLIIIHIATSFLGSATRLELIYTFGFMPAMFTGGFDWNWLSVASPITHIFLHGGWMHLGMNAAMGLALSMFLERTYGTRTTMFFALLCALSGAALYFLISPSATQPVIGASGAISGLFGAMLLTTLQQIQSQPQNIYSSQAIVSGQHALRQKASKIMKDKGPWPILIFWGAFMTLLGMLMGDNISWSSHLGGYACGITLLILIQKGKIRL